MTFKTRLACNKSHTVLELNESALSAEASITDYVLIVAVTVGAYSVGDSGDFLLCRSEAVIQARECLVGIFFAPVRDLTSDSSTLSTTR